MSPRKKVTDGPVFKPGIYPTREAWLEAAVVELTARFADPLADVFGAATLTSTKIRVSCGWPRNDRKGKVIGQCWPGTKSADGARHIFITPLHDGTVEVLDTLLHEMIHAFDNCKSQHKGAFTKACRAVGLAGKPTSTKAGPECHAILTEIAEELGAYPHVKLVPIEIKKPQSTRMLKIVCAGKQPSEYMVRMTQKWLDELGAPLCPCHEKQMLTELQWIERTALRLAAATKRREAKEAANK